MKWYYILLIIFAIFNLIILIIYPFVLSYLLYTIHMVRTKKDKWKRDCSSYKNDEQIKMWNDGLNYISHYKDKIEEVDIYNDNLHLFGEFVNIGSKNTAILLGGRCECLYYAYYYAKPYLENNYNVLVIDSRAHGKSDGKINTVGFFESDDLIAWAKYIHDKYNQENILIHGTCIGAATGIHALAKDNCPTYINKIITDGLFHTYYETFVEHMKALNKPTKPFADITFWFYKKFAKIDAKHEGPINLIDKINKDVKIMFISGLEDKYVSPTKTKELFDKCSCINKEYHYLNHGNHSHLRINQVDEYDKLVVDFIKQ